MRARVRLDAVPLGVTVTVMGDELPAAPVLSVMVAVIENVPAAFGVHARLYGEVVSVPIGLPFAKNCTFEMVLGAPTVAVAVIVVAVPTVPVDGAVSVTVGPDTFETVRVCGADVAVAPFESVTRAVIVCTPNGVADQVAEYGALVSVAIPTPSTRNST